MSWEAMDQLKARMVREGFPLPDLSPQLNENVWRSLSGRVRRRELQALLGMSDAQIDHAVRDLRGMRTVARGKR
jgi:hypothetical protein